MLSKGASNALLKTLEDPPGHVVFVLATTDPQKVEKTISSRTQHLQFHLLPADVLTQHVEYIVKDAGLDLPPDALDYVLPRVEAPLATRCQHWTRSWRRARYPMTVRRSKTSSTRSPTATPREPSPGSRRRCRPARTCAASRNDSSRGCATRSSLRWRPTSSSSRSRHERARRARPSGSGPRRPCERSKCSAVHWSRCATRPTHACCSTSPSCASPTRPPTTVQGALLERLERLERAAATGAASAAAAPPPPTSGGRAALGSHTAQDSTRGGEAADRDAGDRDGASGTDDRRAATLSSAAGCVPLTRRAHGRLGRRRAPATQGDGQGALCRGTVPLRRRERRGVRASHGSPPGEVRRTPPRGRGGAGCALRSTGSAPARGRRRGRARGGACCRRARRHERAHRRAVGSDLFDRSDHRGVSGRGAPYRGILRGGRVQRRRLHGEPAEASAGDARADAGSSRAGSGAGGGRAGGRRAGEGDSHGFPRVHEGADRSERRRSDGDRAARGSHPRCGARRRRPARALQSNAMGGLPALGDLGGLLGGGEPE